MVAAAGEAHARDARVRDERDLAALAAARRGVRIVHGEVEMISSRTRDRAVPSPVALPHHDGRASAPEAPHREPECHAIRERIGVDPSRGARRLLVAEDETLDGADRCDDETASLIDEREPVGAGLAHGAAHDAAAEHHPHVPADDGAQAIDEPQRRDAGAFALRVELAALGLLLRRELMLQVVEKRIPFVLHPASVSAPEAGATRLHRHICLSPSGDARGRIERSEY